MPTYEETVKFIREAHAEQTDKSGVPYWKHPVAVSSIVASVFNGTEDEILAALLHDVVEDTQYTLQDLAQMGYSPGVLEIVRWVSANETRDGIYIDWIRNIAENGPIGAIKVKLADNMHNSDPNRGSNLPSGLMNRYQRSMRILKDALANRQP